jgi:hypothetical protein
MVQRPNAKLLTVVFMNVRLTRSRLSFLWLVLTLPTLALSGGFGCEHQRPSGGGASKAQPEAALTPGVAASALPGSAATASPRVTAEAQLRAYQDAELKIKAALATADLGGAVGFEKHRAAMVARAKSEPVVFVRTPQVEEVPEGVESLRAAFESTDFPWKELKQLRSRFERRPELARQILLREGYLYTEKADHAFTLVSQIKPKHLFAEERIWVHRGPWLMHAVRGEEGDYTFLDGPEQGKKVRLLHLDRVGSGEQVPKPLHRDFRGLRYRLFFERARITHLAEEQIVADLRYGRHWVPTLLKSDGARLDLVAEMIPPEHAAEIAETRALLERKARAVSLLRDAMRAQIDEGLPFDEPKTEEGQQDGTLRRLWRSAYFGGRTAFSFNEDRYPVFDEEGRARVPQVCIDFMVDTFQRASGSWWQPKSAPTRERTQGKLDLKEFEKDDQLRRTNGFLSFAREHEAWFDVLTFPKTVRLQLGYKPTFFRWLEKQADHFEPGDIVFIRGFTPWDEAEEHSHTFFIYESDPLTGVPIAIAGNAGPANLWSWETEARRTPNRTVRDRVRPKIEWLESFLTIDPDVELSPPALVSGRK